MRSERTARIARFHFAGELASNSTLTLPKAVSHHLVTVLRTRTGDVIELFNGDGYNYRATVVDNGQRTPGKRAQLEIHESSKAFPESPVNITLVQAVSRGDRMDTTLRQSVELGVVGIQPVFTRHSVKSLDDKRNAKKIEHWRSIIISACEQSGRATVPVLMPPIAFERWLLPDSCEDIATTLTQQIVKLDASYILSPFAKQSLRAHLQQSQPVESIGLVVGPESGFDPYEIDLATDAQIQAVNVGPRILRTETAGPSCVTIVQSTIGDLI